jgi:hypothetical protein
LRLHWPEYLMEAGELGLLVHVLQRLKERIVREVGYALSLEGASAADLVKSMQAKSEPDTRKGKSHEQHADYFIRPGT